MSNLANLIAKAANANPEALFGTVEHSESLTGAVERAAQLAKHMHDLGYRRGARWALIGHTSSDYMLTWLAAQFAGVELALFNPDYPDELLAAMLQDVKPQAVAWLDRAAIDGKDEGVRQIDLRVWWDAQRSSAPSSSTVDLTSLDGWACKGDDISSYIHTSGTTGRPKFCALSHDYFLRLGRFFADTLCLGSQDRVFAPLSMYHINPLGYGVVGALTARASVLGTQKFSASRFWPLVKEHRFTALVLHPSVSIILATSTTNRDAAGHGVRVAFAAESTLCGLFGIPVGVCGYGSTECAGLSHSWHYRAMDPRMADEGISNYAGRARYDVAWKISEQGEILVRSAAGQAILSGYLRDGKLQSTLDQDGWFHSGDRGRMDAYGNLVFIERLSEAIRVKGEYVPIDFVETKLAGCRSLAPYALWRKESSASGHEVVVYTESSGVDMDELRKVIEQLPRFMRPLRVIRVERLPRAGVNKIQRNRLTEMPEIENIAL